MRVWRQIKKFQVETEIYTEVLSKKGSVDGTRNESKFELGKWEMLTVRKPSEN